MTFLTTDAGCWVKNCASFLWFILELCLYLSLQAYVSGSMIGDE